ncbi:hypothetical protein B5E92_06690 [Erysipelatoclostridium sp. An15]|uniref:glycosyltransferase family 2 protein n=1 Tax=Erysipelatoclostridium sp. An15 TaxID=1965566 RepID=UPI000B36F8E3|nr:glycosyltransferase [Erysipelatoclostridium sp. An15]OUQ07667.1 hypothetical protein B5E92_06690 [Erysipelatoclostridium sp. An15]
MELVSIIVPVYNVEKYLSECIESLINQTYKEIEIILIDDGSTDFSGKICDDYSKKDQRIKVIHKNNEGLSQTRNMGIEIAIGNYICFVDSDDIVSPRYCEILYNLLNDTNYDFSVCNTYRFIDGEKIELLNNKNLTTVISNRDYFSNQINKKTEFGVWNKLFKKQSLNNIRFKKNKLHEDVIFSADLFINLSNGVIITDSQLYYYRQRENSIVHSKSQKSCIDFIYAGRYLIKTSTDYCPELNKECLFYAINYPWSFVDNIYLQRSFFLNKNFLEDLQKLIKDYKKEYSSLVYIDKIKKNRIMLFGSSKFLYFFNVYLRLLRVYIYRILHIDPYKDGHGV